MNRWLQGLLALTCLVVLAEAAFIGWHQFTASQSRAAEADAAQSRASCIEAARRAVANIRDSADADACLRAGYLSGEDISALMAGRDPS